MPNESLLNETQTRTLEAVIAKIFSSVEAERFWDMFTQFDTINQEAMYERIRDFYNGDIRVSVSWYIWKTEPTEYIAISREILELFDGILFSVQEEEIDTTSILHQDIVARFYLFPLDYKDVKGEE